MCSGVAGALLNTEVMPFWVNVCLLGLLGCVWVRDAVSERVQFGVYVTKTFAGSLSLFLSFSLLSFSNASFTFYFQTLSFDRIS